MHLTVLYKLQPPLTSACLTCALVASEWHTVNERCMADVQTWEDPDRRDAVLGVCGDNEPVDVVEISSRPHRTGAVYAVSDELLMMCVSRPCPHWLRLPPHVADTSYLIHTVIVGVVTGNFSQGSS